MVIIPCVAGQFFEGGNREGAMNPRYPGVIIPCVAGQFFEVVGGASPHRQRRYVIIPCVAGQFFEGTRRSPLSSPLSLSLSSSPALRGSSSKRLRARFVAEGRTVIIPCVAGQFFEVSPVNCHRSWLSCHHPLRCGAVLRRKALHGITSLKLPCHHPLRCGAVLRS